jgi:hypothetical protein
MSPLARADPLMLVSFVVKKGWSVLLKPIVRKVVQVKGGSAVAGGELPGGSY